MINRKKRVRYDEGQWFSVPLRTNGYALGIIVRGNYKTKGGLGYFFGPKLDKVPTNENTQLIKPLEAILVTWFGDLSIINGEWLLIESTRSFKREEWPVPRFARFDLMDSTKGWLVEYDQNILGFQRPIRETVCKAEQLAGLYRDGVSGSGAVEIKLTHLLMTS